MMIDYKNYHAMWMKVNEATGIIEFPNVKPAPFDGQAEWDRYIDDLETAIFNLKKEKEAALRVRDISDTL